MKNRNNILLSGLILALSLISFYGQAQVVNVNPDPNGDPWYVGGDGPLSEKARERLEAIPEFPYKQRSYSKENLPSELDNSLQPFFRPVFVQEGGSCSQASGVSYIFTYEMDYIRGVHADQPENQYPSHYTYNFLNKGSGENGSMYTDDWQIIKEMGCPNVLDYGGLYNLGNTGWMSAYNKYHAGMHHTLFDYYTINVSTPEGLDNLKAWFFNHMNDTASVGGLACFSAGASDMEVKHLPLGTPHQTDFIVTEWDSTIDHAMTFVGYNDSVRYDWNGDGQFTNDIDITGDGLVTMADWEIGALIMANSWGSGWCDGGKAFVMYRLLVGGAHIRDSKVYVIDPKQFNSPLMAIKLEMAHNSRKMLKIWATASNDTTLEEGEYEKEFKALSKKGGDYPMDGVNDTIEFGLDISSLLSEINEYEDMRFNLHITEKDTGMLGNGSILNYSIMSYLDGVQEYLCDSANISIIDDSKTSMSIIIPGNGFYPPTNLMAQTDERAILLNWDYPQNHPADWKIAGYHLYRNGSLLESFNDSTILYYEDEDLKDGTYHYTITCEYEMLSGTNNYESQQSEKASGSILLNPVAGAGYHLTFDGDDTYLVTEDSIHLKEQCFSLEFWAKKEVANGDIMVMGHGSWGKGSKALHYGFRDNRYYCGFYGDDISTDTAYLDTDWHHYAMTFDTATYVQKLYRDGALVQERIADTLYLGEGPLYIGAVSNKKRIFRGNLDELRVWNSVRTQQEIQDFMYFPVADNHPDLQAYFRLDERAGDKTFDFSINDHRATLEAFPFEREKSSLWTIHQMEEDSLLILHAGYSLSGGNLNYEITEEPQYGNLILDMNTQELSYDPVSPWEGYDQFTYVLSNGLDTDTCHLIINPDQFPVIGIEEFTDLTLFVYPNPSSGIIFLETNQSKMQASYQVFNMEGKLLLSDKMHQQYIDLSHLKTGMYLLLINTNSKTFSTKISILN
jgi:hypothetical protein